MGLMKTKCLFLEKVAKTSKINMGAYLWDTLYLLVIVELRANSSPHSVPGRAQTQTQVLGPKTQFELGLE